jgi:hypothetical protein
MEQPSQCSKQKGKEEALPASRQRAILRPRSRRFPRITEQCEALWEQLLWERRLSTAKGWSSRDAWWKYWATDRSLHLSHSIDDAFLLPHSGKNMARSEG